MRGRKPKLESRGTEIRARLTAWKQTPEYSRPSLRQLALELGTSHQLLSHYLESWAKWQEEECRRRAEEIRDRAWEIENRTLTPWEDQQARAYDQKAFQWMLEVVMAKAMRRFEHEANTSGLKRTQVKTLRILASRGYAKAQKILEKLSDRQESKNNLPAYAAPAAKSFRST
jgi:hypothetical protein